MTGSLTPHNVFSISSFCDRYRYFKVLLTVTFLHSSICTEHICSPSINRWTFRLFLILITIDQCCYEYLCRNFCVTFFLKKKEKKNLEKVYTRDITFMFFKCLVQWYLCLDCGVVINMLAHLQNTFALVKWECYTREK